MWPTFDCPYSAPSVKLVEPVQTSLGWPFSSRTMNLLCAIFVLVRLVARAVSCSAAIPAVFCVAG